MLGTSCGACDWRYDGRMSKMRWALVLLCLVFLSSNLAFARGAPGGHYRGGRGSSHKAGSYKNPRTNDHYQKRHGG
jgi:hypothetical protein